MRTCFLCVCRGAGVARSERLAAVWFPFINLSIHYSSFRILLIILSFVCFCHSFVLLSTRSRLAFELFFSHFAVLFSLKKWHDTERKGKTNTLNKMKNFFVILFWMSLKDAERDGFVFSLLCHWRCCLMNTSEILPTKTKAARKNA